MAQAFSFISISRAEDAFDVKVPAKDAGVHGLNGTKTVERVDPISPAKLTSTVDDQLPPLLSMIVDGLPPIQQSKYVPEAEKRLHQYIERYSNVIHWDSYVRVGLSSASFVHPGVISVDRLVAICKNYILLFLLDDLFFDTPEIQEQYGVSRSACESPQYVKEHLEHLYVIFSQEAQPRNPPPLVETLVWEIGRETLELSNPEWFRSYVAGVKDHHRASSASFAAIVHGHYSCFLDLDSYTAMRTGNFGGYPVQLLIEFANDAYIPDILKVNPHFENVSRAVGIHLGFANDVFSYHKENTVEQNPRNLITVLMQLEGKPFVQAMHMAIDVVNTYGRAVVDWEAEACNSGLQNHWQDLKALIAGNVYYGCRDDRYRHRDSVFPEHRDTTKGTWKILPHAKGAGL